MKHILSRQYVRYGLFILGGILLGWLFFHSSENKSEDKHEHATHEREATVWTCSMHPQIRRSEPGKCPICGMDLIPLVQKNAPSDSGDIQFTNEAAALANVLTSVVSRQKPVKDIRLYGKVQIDERLLQSQTSHVTGRIEKLLVNFTGESVQKGQTLAIVYSPELVTAEQELLESAKAKESQPEIYQAAKDRLRQWKLTEHQISAIEKSGKVKENIEVVSNTTGVVIAKRVNNGDYVGQGTVLYDVANLSRLWVMFDAYESDLPFLRKDDPIAFTLQAMPGMNFTGKVLFIDPFIDPTTRVSKVRVEISNQSGRLKPEMFATGIVHANVSAYKDKLVIPGSAVLWTGKRSIVYVKQPNSENPVFKLREVELGPALGGSYLIVHGLREGEEIVTQGAFNVDAAAQLEGKPSMMDSKKYQ